MKESTKIILKNAWDYCIEQDKSTEFAIQYMMDTANVSHDCIMNWLYKNRDKEVSHE
jgi:hypothetical protein